MCKPEYKPAAHCRAILQIARTIYKIALHLLAHMNTIPDNNSNSGLETANKFAATVAKPAFRQAQGKLCAG